MLRAIAVMAACLMVAVGAARLTAPAPIHTHAGIVQGGRVGETTYYLGVPFAEKPVGNLRFRSPLPKAPWEGTLEALKFGPDCATYKSSDYIKFHNISEDCLYLNIFVPSGAGPSSALPVMHFLYGGSWEWGGSSFAIYDSAPVVAERGNVIFVTSNYRLGMFGYLGGAALAAESSDGSTGNYGLQDQRMAMEWIRDNIASFGGDPGNVMLFGQSAGSGSVANHLIMPRSSGLFQRAGMESGPPCDWTAIPLDVSEAKFHVLCGDAGCCPGGKVPDAASIACLRGKSMAAIANLSHHSGGGLLDWSPVIDGVEITEEPQQLVQQGKVNPIKSVLLGTVHDEGTLFLPVKYPLSEAAYTQFILDSYGTKLGQQILSLYPASNYAAPWWAASDVFTDSLMACPARRTANWMSTANVPVFLYQFVYEPLLIKLAEPSDGVCHSAEIPFVFHYDPVLIGSGEIALSNQVVDYWTNFAATGNPFTPAPGRTVGVPGVVWPRYNTTSRGYLSLDIPVAASANLKAKPCAFWDALYNKGCNLIQNNSACQS